MAEQKKDQPKIIELMGKEDKKKMKRTHKAIQKAFINNGQSNGKRPRRGL